MFKKSLIAAGLLAASTSASAVSYGFFDARSVAMGNVSVATGHITTAALSNPAMMSINEQDETFALLLPAIGVQAIDNGGMIDLVDDLQALDETNPANANQLINLANQLATTSIFGNASVNAALVHAGDTFAIGFSYRGAGAVDALYDQTLAGVPGVSAPQGNLVSRGLLVQEIGVALSAQFNLLGVDVALGVRPKTVSMETLNFTRDIYAVDTDNIIDDAVEEDLGDFNSVDAGVAFQVFDSITLGVVARNLIEDSFTDSSLNKYNFDTHLRAGVAYTNSFLTIAADMDLTEIDPIASEDPSKMMGVGVELNALDFMQIRVGYQSNVADGADEPDLISAGLGLWLGFHLDVAVVAGDDDSLGAFVQTGFRF